MAMVMPMAYSRGRAGPGKTTRIRRWCNSARTCLSLRRAMPHTRTLDPFKPYLRQLSVSIQECSRQVSAFSSALGGQLSVWLGRDPRTFKAKAGLWSVQVSGSSPQGVTPLKIEHLIKLDRVQELE